MPGTVEKRGTGRWQGEADPDSGLIESSGLVLHPVELQLAEMKIVAQPVAMAVQLPDIRAD